MKDPVRKEEIIITMTLDLRNEREFTLPGVRDHRVVEVAWLTKSTNSHPVTATCISQDRNKVKYKLSIRFSDLPEDIKATLLRNMHVGDAPSETWYPSPKDDGPVPNPAPSIWQLDR